MARSQSEIILMGCMIAAVFIVMTNMKITMSKEIFESYNEVAFIAEPYLASLANMEIKTDCGTNGVYSLLMMSASNDSNLIYPCGTLTEIDLEEELKPLHEQFMCNFGKRYYLTLYNRKQEKIFSLPEDPNESCPEEMIEDENGTVTVFRKPCVILLAQMPIPIEGGNSTRLVLSRADDYGEEVECE